MFHSYKRGHGHGRPHAFEREFGSRHHNQDRDFERGPRRSGPRGSGHAPDHGSEFGRGHGPGPGSWGGHGPGSGRGFRGFRGFHGPTARRGDVRAAILVLLAERPMHGYEIISQLGERSGGRWVPSAGSVYPTLQQLEDEGLVTGDEQEGRKVFALTDAGRQAASQASERPAPWNAAAADEDLFSVVRPLMAAVSQVNQVGSPETVEKAREILVQARRSIYQLLAEEGDAPR